MMAAEAEGFHSRRTAEEGDLKRWALGLGALVALTWVAAARPQADPPPSVRVRLNSWGRLTSVSLEGEGLTFTAGARQRRTTSLAVEIAPGGQLRLQAEGWDRAVDSSVRVSAAAGPVWVHALGRKRAYPGVLTVAAKAGRLRLVNEAPFEDYVAGVLSAETPAAFGLAARQASAVAIRGYTLRKLRSSQWRRGLADTVRCQVFPGTGRVSAAHWEAVRSTAGEAPFFDGEPIEAVYSSDCGGRTANNEEAWPGGAPVPYLRGGRDSSESHPDPFCAGNRAHHWEARLSDASLRRLAPEAGSPLSVQVLERSESGRAIRVRVGSRGEAGEVRREASVELSGRDLRRRLGAGVVRSLRFEVSLEDGATVLRGAGSGHGVGMCQFGANGMAAAGYGYREILAHYYRGVVVRRLSATMLAHWLAPAADAAG